MHQVRYATPARGYPTFPHDHYQVRGVEHAR
jgi:hypothetical protein